MLTSQPLRSEQPGGQELVLDGNSWQSALESFAVSLRLQRNVNEAVEVPTLMHCLGARWFQILGEVEEEEAGYAEGATESYCTEQKKPKVIFMMGSEDADRLVCLCAGGPASGKAVQCERMEERFNLRRLSLADLLCSELQGHGDRGRRLRDVLERGERLPEDTMLELLCDAVASSVRQGKGLVVGDPSAVFLLSCSPDTMSSRLQCRGNPPDSSSLQQWAESSGGDGRAVAAHYQRKRLLHTVRPPHTQHHTPPQAPDQAPDQARSARSAPPLEGGSAPRPERSGSLFDGHFPPRFERNGSVQMGVYISTKRLKQSRWVSYRITWDHTQSQQVKM
ncbi:unnamed protein product [Menidia menidia]|uniref:(Atlantic silverside) hypothetical protein n=1 Tax=Menidia menidia TaxID=238744 RepID=A0A8S4AUY7_9TELE|nr:unnamed protein product [Menidia menidia]